MENMAVVPSRETVNAITSYEQLQVGGDNGDIDTLLNSIRLSNENIDSRNLELVNEMINDTGDDRNNIHQIDKVVLIVEDDIRFGKILIERAHEEGLKAVVATATSRSLILSTGSIRSRSHWT